MKQLLLTIGVVLLTVTSGIAQSNPLDKKMDKAKELIKKEKFDDADEYIEKKILADNPEFGDAWDLLVKLRYKAYKDAKQSDGLFENMTVTTKDKDGKEIKDDSLANSLMTLMASIKPSKIAFNKYIYTLRKATMLSHEAEYCGVILRNYFVDEAVDTAVSKKALKYFNDAEQEFSNKNYEKAAKYYQRAIDEQPDFYKASLYLGDCHYALGNYVQAIEYFSKAKEKFPNQLEPRKYLTDAYAKEKLYEKSLQEAIATTAVYPDIGMYIKLEDAAYMNNKKIDIKWTPRGCFPNRIKEDKYAWSNDDEKKKMVTKDPWTIYEKALQDVKADCDENGVIKAGTANAKSKYLEVYSWEQMLKNSADPSLAEAKRMQADGYLDCYVLVSCYHIDCYDQYADFVKNNSEKILKYYNKYIIAN